LTNVLVLQALTWQARGNNAQAITVLGQALSFAEPGGYIRTFVDEGPRMAELLTMLLKAKQKGRLAEYTFTADYASRLLLAFGSSEQPQEVKPNSATSFHTKDGSIVQPLLAPLSERELEVLRLIVAGLSNQQIAQQLVVEKNTLKTHIKHLYRKLHISSRTRAIARARELNLL
jgi:LuxR family maltose regulon positive regulatory protein